MYNLRGIILIGEFHLILISITFKKRNPWNVSNESCESKGPAPPNVAFPPRNSRPILRDFLVVHKPQWTPNELIWPPLQLLSAMCNSAQLYSHLVFEKKRLVGDLVQIFFAKILEKFKKHDEDLYKCTCVILCNMICKCIYVLCFNENTKKRDSIDVGIMIR